MAKHTRYLVTIKDGSTPADIEHVIDTLMGLGAVYSVKLIEKETDRPKDHPDLFGQLPQPMRVEA